MKKSNKPNLCVVIVKDDYTENLVRLLELHYNIANVVIVGGRTLSDTIDDLNNVSENTETIAVFGENTGILWDNILPGNKFGRKNSTKQRASYTDRLISIANDYELRTIGFGMGSVYLAIKRNCNLLFNKCSSKSHDTTFIVGGDEDVRFNVNSDHSIVIYPINLKNYMYDIRAFGTYYSQLKYFDAQGTIVEVGKNFVEPEIIKIGNTTLFHYNIPTNEEPVVSNLTIQNILL